MLLIAITSSATFFLFVLCFAIVFIWHKIEKQLQPQTDSQSLMLYTQQIFTPKNMSDETLDSILRGNLIHQGYNSAVRLATLEGRTVAVKVYQPRSKMQWVNEKDIYGMLGEHPNIAKVSFKEFFSFFKFVRGAIL